jgi:hypothetical protein
MARIIDEPRNFTNPDDFNSQIKEYISVKNTIDMMETRRTDLRTNIFDYLEQHGEYDEKGNIFFELPASFDGYVRVEKTKRVTRKIDESAAEAILAENQLEEEIYETVRVVSEDKLMAAFYEGKITEDELERIFPAKVVWALTPKKK